VSQHTESARRRLLNAIQEHMIPQLRQGDMCHVVLAEPPFHLSGGVTLTGHPGKPLSARKADRTFCAGITHYWAQPNVHSARFPYMGFVVEGEFDLRIGVTTRMSRHLKKSAGAYDYAVLGLPKGTFFLMPPTVPYSSAYLNHWERSAPEPHSRQAIWVQFHALGMQCHFSYASDGKLISEPPYYLADPHTFFAVEALTEELRLRRGASSEISRSLLQFMAYRLQRGLQKLTTTEPENAIRIDGNLRNVDGAVQQACAYIESNYDKKLSVEEIALHSGLSPSYLGRLFMQEKGISIMEYLTRFRLECACLLLAGTQLNIYHIAQNVGYPNHPYFCQIFQRRFGCSPRDYRKSVKTKDKVK
jgi:AraC-like DNA-binding protein